LDFIIGGVVGVMSVQKFEMNNTIGKNIVIIVQYVEKIAKQFMIGMGVNVGIVVKLVIKWPVQNVIYVALI